MRPYIFPSIVTWVLGIISFMFIYSCSNSKTQNIQDNPGHDKEIILNKFFLSIPMDLTKDDAFQLLDNYEKDSLIRDMSDYSYRANNFEQILAEVDFGDVNFRFDTNFIVKMNDNISEDTDPVAYLIFYNQQLLALELEIRDFVIYEKSTIKTLSDSITSMFSQKYGQPSLRNKRLDTFDLGNINHEIDINETKMSDGSISRRWKENVKSELTEWIFQNAIIRIITSQYKEYLALNYKKEKPTEYTWDSIHIFYINTSTVANHDQDLTNYMDSLELLNKQKEIENKLQDSIKNVRNSMTYDDQYI